MEGRRFLGVPLADLAACLFLTGVLTAAAFLPALEGFGKVLFGEHDMHLFLWVFWHFENSLKSGESPFFAREIFYPHGISLSLSTTTPLQSALYSIMPDAWGAFGKVTLLQALSFLLGGIFSFALAYRFTQSLLPSLAGSLIFDFSPFHFEKALLALNYSMAMPFVAAFFLFYYDCIGRPGRKGPLALLSLSLLLVALSELTVAIMAGFVVLIDIFRRYMEASGRPLLAYESCLMALVASLSAYGLFIFLLQSGAPAALAYNLPPALFISALVIFVLGTRNLADSERRFGHARMMALCALPALAYMAFLAAQPAYKYMEEDWAGRLRFYSKPIEYVLFPSGLQAVSGYTGGAGLGSLTSAGVYVGPVLLLLLLLSFAVPGAGGDESHFRWMGIACVLFSFPLLITTTELLAPTPFVVQPLFPMMAVLREPARFILFGLLFLSVAAGLLVKRLAGGRGDLGRVASLALIVLLAAERWPALGSHAFDGSVPEFYRNLAEEGGKRSLLLANFDYDDLLDESYFQTVHGKSLSYGLVSRFPGEEPLASLGTPELFGNMTMGAGPVVSLAERYGYDYVVLHKEKEESFRQIRPALEARFARIYEDGFMVVYKT